MHPTVKTKFEFSKKYFFTLIGIGKNLMEFKRYFKDFLKKLNFFKYSLTFFLQKSFTRSSATFDVAFFAIPTLLQLIHIKLEEQLELIFFDFFSLSMENFHQPSGIEFHS